MRTDVSQSKDDPRQIKKNQETKTQTTVDDEKDACCWAVCRLIRLRFNRDIVDQKVGIEYSFIEVMPDMNNTFKCESYSILRLFSFRCRCC